MIKKYIGKLRKFRIVDLAIIIAESISHNNKLKWLEIETIASYCLRNKGRIVVIEPEMNRPIYVPAFFRSDAGKEYSCKSSEIYVAYLENVMVVGATGIVLAEKKVLFDATKQDKENRMVFRWGAVKWHENNKMLVEVSRNITEIDTAINLCGFASANYYHFTVEIISRLDYVNKLHVPEEVPVLIDAEIRQYAQLEQLLEIVKGNRDVIYVPGSGRIMVRSLVQPSMNTWMPFNVRSRDLFRLSDNLIAESALQNIRTHIKSYMSEQTAKKIYFSRKNTQLCRVVNEDEIILLFEKAGFEIVCTESLSYLEQVRLFSSAKCVVGATGAALTNVLYCHPGTVVGCIIPKEYEFCIYSTMAYLLGCETLFFNPEIVSRHKFISRDLFYVDTEKCKKYIEELNVMTGEK